MSRIRKAYETRFRWLLQRVGARRLEQGVEWLTRKAQRLGTAERISFGEALAQVHENLTARRPFRPRPPATPPGRFFCDAGLGGLARWLRAAGYETFWEAGIDDDDLLRKARDLSATILTTDSMLMERSLLRKRVIPAFWLPPVYRIPEQLEIVFREFGLQLRERRCMACGGELARANKEAVREQIPPRTRRWLDDYFVCTRCGKLFWHGTHWQRIEAKLKAVAETRQSRREIF